MACPEGKILYLELCGKYADAKQTPPSLRSWREYDAKLEEYRVHKLSCAACYLGPESLRSNPVLRGGK